MKVVHISNYRRRGGGTAVARAAAMSHSEDAILLFLEPGSVCFGPEGRPAEYGCGFRDFAFVRKLVEELIAADGGVILQCHGRRPGLWGRALRGLHPRRVRTILSFHGIASFTPLKKALVAAQESVLSLATDQFIAAAPAEIDMFRFLPMAAPIALIPYGYNRDSIVPWTPRRIRRLGFCARFERPKLHDHLIETVAAYNATASEPIALVFAGDGSLRKATDRLGFLKLGKHYLSLGHVTHVREFYAQIDAFAHFSCYEGLPIGLIDAMACGMPCIASDVIGCRDAIESGESGLLVPVGDIETGAAAIRYIVEARDEARRLAENARARALKQFSPEVFWKRHLEIYGRLERQLRKSPS